MTTTTRASTWVKTQTLTLDSSRTLDRVNVRTSDAIALAALVDLAEEEGVEVHVFGGGGFWLLEWRTPDLKMLSVSHQTLHGAVRALRERVGVDW